MTLIVGVKCKSGVVLGADTSVTYVTALGQQTTIRQDTQTKLHVSHDKAIVAVSGPISLLQSYSDELDAYITNKGMKVAWKSTQQAKTELSGMFWGHAKPLWERAGVMAPAAGQAAAAMEASHQTAVAFAIENDAHLIQFSAGCVPEEATEDLPFFALGSGQASADVFLAFIRKIFWPQELPSVSEGELATIWTLDEIKRQIPGFVGGETKVATLKQSENGKWKVFPLSEDDITTHRQGITAIEAIMPEAAKVATGAAASSGPIPEPEPPPAT